MQCPLASEVTIDIYTIDAIFQAVGCQSLSYLSGLMYRREHQTIVLHFDFLKKEMPKLRHKE